MPRAGVRSLPVTTALTSTGAGSGQMTTDAMTDVDTSILDELKGRQRRAALRQRGAASGRVKTPMKASAPRRKPKPRKETPEQRRARTAAAREARAANAETRREEELDTIADALLSICSRLEDEGYTAAPRPATCTCSCHDS